MESDLLRVSDGTSGGKREKKKLRIYTCTPVSFRADESTFFMRDTGLICTKLLAMDVESKCIMPLPNHEGDLTERIIRTDMYNLKDPDWWRARKLDGLVLYSWGAPRFIKVARAVHKAGIPLYIHVDASSFDPWWEPSIPLAKRIPLFFRRMSIDWFRALHFSYADVISASLPFIEKNFRKRRFYGERIADKCVSWPAPVEELFRYDDTEKKRRVICVGRWDDAIQKRPHFLMRVLELVAQRCGDVEADIYGFITEEMERWHAGLPEESRCRIRLCGFLDHSCLPSVYNDAQVLLVPSSFEGTCLAAAEALCCGCSLVVSNRPGKMDNLMWYTTLDAGAISCEDTPESMADAVLEELERWLRGERNARDIAAAWQPFFHMGVNLNRILKIFEKVRLSDVSSK